MSPTRHMNLPHTKTTTSAPAFRSDLQSAENLHKRPQATAHRPFTRLRTSYDTAVILNPLSYRYQNEKPKKVPKKIIKKKEKGSDPGSGSWILWFHFPFHEAMKPWSHEAMKSKPWSMKKKEVGCWLWEDNWQHVAERVENDTLWIRFLLEVVLGI